MGDEFLCSLCLCNIQDKHFDVVEESMKEVLDVIFKNKTLTKTQAICESCSLRIRNIFNFKCMCIYTEDFLNPLTNKVANLPINLKEVYTEKNGNSINWNNQHVCRLCLQLVNGYFTSLSHGIERDMVQKYLPEVAIQNTTNPIACRKCIESVYYLAAFVSDCTNIEKNKCGKQENEAINGIYNCMKVERDANMNVGNSIGNNKASQTMISINDLDFCAKKEDGIRSERNDKGSLRVSYCPYLFQEMCEQKPKEIDIRYSNLYHLLESTPAEDIGPYKFDQFNQELKDKLDDESSILYDLDLHMLQTKEQTYRKQPEETSRAEKVLKKHDISKGILYDCEHCDYQTKYANALKSHMLNHKKPSEIRMYRCDNCDYKTKYRNALKSHQLNHKPSTEISMRKCNLCSYETKHRTALVLHMLKHKNPDEIQMYKCDQCKFQTKFKHALKPHKLKHKNKT